MSHLLSLSTQDLSALQDAWANVILQSALFPESLADLPPDAVESKLAEIDADCDKPGAEGQRARAQAAYLFTVLRDSVHLSHSGRSALLVGLNGRGRAIYDTAVASVSAGTSK